MCHSKIMFYRSYQHNTASLKFILCFSNSKNMHYNLSVDMIEIVFILDEIIPLLMIHVFTVSNNILFRGKISEKQ